MIFSFHPFKFFLQLKITSWCKADRFRCWTKSTDASKTANRMFCLKIVNKFWEKNRFNLQKEEDKTSNNGKRFSSYLNLQWDHHIFEKLHVKTEAQLKFNHHSKHNIKRWNIYSVRSVQKAINFAWAQSTEFFSSFILYITHKILVFCTEIDWKRSEYAWCDAIMYIFRFVYAEFIHE